MTIPSLKPGTTLLTDGHRSYPGLTDYRYFRSCRSPRNGALKDDPTPGKAGRPAAGNLQALERARTALRPIPTRPLEMLWITGQKASLCPSLIGPFHLTWIEPVEFRTALILLRLGAQGSRGVGFGFACSETSANWIRAPGHAALAPSETASAAASGTEALKPVVFHFMR